MKVKVNEQPQRFYLAMDNWFAAVGHGIQIGDIQLCAIPMDGIINISEVTSGARMMRYQLNFIEWLITEDKEGFLNYLQRVGEDLVKRLSKHKDLDQQIEKLRDVAIERLGPMPAIEDVDVEELLERAQQ
ncbi:hypothetical protein [Sporosarcina koreensis]|uniref:hypothetical protein n=1 Tax=Sporosarcina koreensis TaxID=334735 RepID=UPI00075C681C|nr:hypothetical protein [Sporosarcina koreensis]